MLYKITSGKSRNYFTWKKIIIKQSIDGWATSVEICKWYHFKNFLIYNHFNVINRVWVQGCWVQKIKLLLEMAILWLHERHELSIVTFVHDGGPSYTLILMKAFLIQMFWEIKIISIIESFNDLLVFPIWSR